MTTVSATPLLGTVNNGARIIAVVPAAGNNTDLYVTAIREDNQRDMPGMPGVDTYITWATNRDRSRGFYWGHYFEGDDSQANKTRALTDMATRAGIITDCPRHGGPVGSDDTCPCTALRSVSTGAGIVADPCDDCQTDDHTPAHCSGPRD
jgi:hypothetical protein